MYCGLVKWFVLFVGFDIDFHFERSMSVCTVVIRFGTYGYIIFIGPCVNADIIVDEREISVFFWKNGCDYVVLGYFHRTVCAAQCNQSSDVILKEADRSCIYAVLEYLGP